MAIDSKYGQVSIPGIPDDEPIFVLRGQDLATPQTINNYADNAIGNGSPPEHAESARRRSSEIREWQQENADQVKAAD